MRNFVQLKDGIGFAYHQSEGETDGIEVFDDHVNYLNKRYANGEWVEAEAIKYAIVNEAGNIIEMCTTYFPSVVGTNPIVTSDVQPSSKWDGSNWVNPTPAE